MQKVYFGPSPAARGGEGVSSIVRKWAWYKGLRQEQAPGAFSAKEEIPRAFFTTFLGAGFPGMTQAA